MVSPQDDDSIRSNSDDGDVTSSSSPSSQEQEVSAFHDFVAGGASGTAAVLVGHPFDTIKVRLQTAAASKTVAAPSIVQLATSFGGFGSLFRGMAAPLASATAVNAVLFSGYGTSSRLWDEHMPQIKNYYYTNNNPTEGQANGAVTEGSVTPDSWQKAYFCGCFGGFVQCFIICPMEHIKCRLQVQHAKGAADHVFNGPIDATTTIVKEYGIRGLFRGWWSTILREVPSYGAYFATYEYIKHSVNNFLIEFNSTKQQPTNEPQNLNPWLSSALAGGCSGCLTWASVYPVDVIKSKIQTSPLGKPALSIWRTGQQLVAANGGSYSILYRGLGVCIIRAFPVNATIFPVYEFTLHQIQRF